MALTPVANTDIGQLGAIGFASGGYGSPVEQWILATRGSFVLNGTTAVTVADAGVTATSVILPTLKTVGGTVGALPAVQTITAGTGFTVAGTAADTSTYNYLRLG